MPIFEQGYQHWSGELSGHSWRWLAITRHGVRNGLQSTIVRIILLLAWLPAIGLAFAMAVWGLAEQKSSFVQPILAFFDILTPQMAANPKNYRVEAWTICYTFFLLAELRFSMILILAVGPSLISQDIRFNALPLYFSRPVRRIDYFLGKLGVIGWFLGMVLVLPSVVAFVLGLLFSLDFTIFVDALPVLIVSISYGLAITLSAGMLVLALSSLSRNSRYIGLFWVAVWLITSAVGTLLEGVNREQKMHERFVKMREAERANTEANRVKKTPKGNKGNLAEQNKLNDEILQRQNESQRKFDQIMDEELEDAKSDWRPLISYTGNLTRIGDVMLGTDNCWRKLSLDEPPERRGQYLIMHLGPQYPWRWSAAVLLVLIGISACILNFRVKSLDRLK